jgi:dephospho-CoA kinase
VLVIALNYFWGELKRGKASLLKFPPLPLAKGKGIKGMGLPNKNPLTVWLTLVRLGGMKVIGLTGGIGSGKSTVSQFLKELGVVIIDADKVGHEVFEPDTDAWREVVAAFGLEIVKPDGDIDRKKLGKIVFGEPKALARLNKIMHPRIYAQVKAKVEEYRRRGVKVVALEVPLLVEADWASLVNEVWVTVAPESTVVRRLKEKGGLSEPEILARIRSQLPSAERIKHADVVIDTDCDLAELKEKVKRLWDRLALDT